MLSKFVSLLVMAADWVRLELKTVIPSRRRLSRQVPRLWWWRDSDSRDNNPTWHPKDVGPDYNRNFFKALTEERFRSTCGWRQSQALQICICISQSTYKRCLRNLYRARFMSNFVDVNWDRITAAHYEGKLGAVWAQQRYCQRYSLWPVI